MPQRILFICTGCINRSAAAHVILESEGGYEVKSCGTGKVAPKGQRMAKKMREALRALGYDPENHRSQGISEDLLSWADLIVCMGNVHEKYIAEHHPQYSHKVENWRVKDPHFCPGTSEHERVAKELRERVFLRFFPQ